MWINSVHITSIEVVGVQSTVEVAGLRRSKVRQAQHETSTVAYTNSVNNTTMTLSQTWCLLYSRCLSC